jgi:hypothetical protein
MADNDTPASPPTNDAAIERMFTAHQAHLASYNSDDRSSPVFGRPDLATEYKARAQADFDAICARHGIVPPAAPTPEQVAEQRLDAEMPRLDVSEDTANMIDGVLGQYAETPHARPGRVAQAMKDVGGPEAYGALIAAAKAGLGPDIEWLPEAEESLPVLRLLASYGRYHAEYARRLAALHRKP